MFSTTTCRISILIFLPALLVAAPQPPPTPPAKPEASKLVLRLRGAIGDQLPVLLQQHLLHKVREVVFYRGQYEELRPLRQRVGPWLEKWVRQAPKVPEPDSFRRAAMRALRDLHPRSPPDSTLAALRHAADSKDNDPGLRDHAVLILADLGDCERRDRMIEEARAWTRRDAPRMRSAGYLRLAQAAYVMEQYPEAARHYLALPPIYAELDARPKDLRATYYNAACCLAKAGQPERAAAVLQQAIDTHWIPRAAILADRDLAGFRQWSGYPAFLQRNYGVPIKTRRVRKKKF